MAQAVQIQFRRGTTVQLSGFTPASGEIVVDTDNNQAVIGDSTLAGGYYVASQYRVGVSGNYTMNAWDRVVAYTALAGARTVTLPATTAVSPGAEVLIVDESGSGSTTLTITPARSVTTDLINGSSVAGTNIVNSAYGYIRLMNSSSGRWTVVT